MRIALVVPAFPREAGEACLPYLADLVASVAGAHAIEVFAMSHRAEREDYALFGAPVRARGARTRREKALALRRIPALIERRHRERPFDLVHAWWAGLPALIGTRAARRLGVPSVVSLGGRELKARGEPDAPGPLTRWLVRRSLPSADRLTVGSAWLGRRLPRGLHADVLRLGVDTARFAPAPARRGASLLAVGGLWPMKDPLVVVRAVARVRAVRPDATLRWVGDGPLREAVRREAAALDVPVALDGEIPHADVPAAMRGADRLICASPWESQGLVVTEALATGLPVVSRPVGVVPELGGLVRAWEGAEAELAAAILASLRDRAHGGRVAVEGPAWVGRHGSTAAAVERLEALWWGCVEARRA